jgi:hypothetical protein
LAKKILCIGVIIALASLAQAAPGSASLYAFPGKDATVGAWTAMHGAVPYQVTIALKLEYDFKSPGKLSLTLNLPGIPGLSPLELELFNPGNGSQARPGGIYRQKWREILYDLHHDFDNTILTLTATWTEILRDNNQFGFITDFSFSVSHDNPPAAPVPLPGAVWLLGTGLLGLGCLERRRRKVS